MPRFQLGHYQMLTSLPHKSIFSTSKTVAMKATSDQLIFVSRKADQVCACLCCCRPANERTVVYVT
jgi:hypothetical protein